MESRKEVAISKHDKGYNCAQAVACTYADLVDMSEEQLFRITEGMGLGMGNMTGTCGALSGAVALTGLLNSGADLAKPATKAATYGLTKVLMTRFKERNGSVICGDLKGVNNGGKVLRACPDCIRDACEFFEELYEAKLKK